MVITGGATALGFDAREVAAYSYAQASRILGVPASTIRAWKKGQDYRSSVGVVRRFEEPIPTSLSHGLSYFDLAEIFVLRSLRVEHRYPLAAIREAMEIAHREHGIKRLLLHQKFRHGGKELFLERWEDFVSLSPTHQLAFREILDGYLDRVEYDADGWTFGFSPVIRERGFKDPQVITINPRISFGRPVVKSKGIRTAAIASRLDAGEGPAHVMADFDLTQEEFDQAVLLEAA